jgi:hypothetical protein
MDPWLLITMQENETVRRGKHHTSALRTHTALEHAICSVVAVSVGIFTPCLAEAANQPDLALLVGQAEGQRDGKIKEVRSVRYYIVRNSRWKSDGTMEAVMITSGDGSKRYEILSMNADGLRKRILIKILDGEVEAAANKERDGNVNAANYELQPLTLETAGGRTCRPVKLVPKKRTRFTLEGHGCIDMTDMAMVHMEGRTAKNISFFVGKAYVTQEFRKMGEFWYSATSRSTADVKLLGKTELIIEYVSYTITPKTGAIVTALPTTRHADKR